MTQTKETPMSTRIEWVGRNCRLLKSTQPATVEYLQAHGIEVLAEQTKDPARHAKFLDEIFDRHPDIFLDNGGDLFARYAASPWHDWRTCLGTAN